MNATKEVPAIPVYPISISEMRRRYLNLYAGAVNDVLRFKYKMHSTCLPSEYAPLREGMRIAGLAFTIKGAPDIVVENEMEFRAQMLEALHEDSVVVWDCTKDTLTAQWGEIMTMAAKKRGCRGAVVNGIRDTDSILEQEFPIFHIYRSNAGMFGRFRLYHYQKPVLVGEVIINPGDWVFGDIDGVLVIPSAITYDVLLAAEDIVHNEVNIRDVVQSGMRPTDVVRNGGYF